MMMVIKCWGIKVIEITLLQMLTSTQAIRNFAILINVLGLWVCVRFVHSLPSRSVRLN
jgi:hypothetical protein